MVWMRSEGNAVGLLLAFGGMSGFNIVVSLSRVEKSRINCS
jgi:hypothetical protein